MTSEWRQVNRLHEVSEDGIVRNIKTKNILKPGIGTNGRPHIGIRINGNYKTQYVHVLVCTAFHGPRPEGMWVSHLNGNVLDNRASNLAWETPGENLARKIEHGTHDRNFSNSRASLSKEDVVLIRTLRAQGYTHNHIAEKVGVARVTISRVLNGKRYTNEDTESALGVKSSITPIETVDTIISMFASGIPRKEIASTTGVNYRTVSGIIQRSGENGIQYGK